MALVGLDPVENTPLLAALLDIPLPNERRRESGRTDPGEAREGMRPVDQPILERIPANDRNIAASMASASTHRERKAAVGGGFGLRFCRPKPFHAGVYQAFGDQSWRLAARSSRMSSNFGNSERPHIRLGMNLAELKMCALCTTRTISRNGADLCVDDAIGATQVYFRRGVFVRRLYGDVHPQ
jgi:hypothetical protein